MDTIQIDSSTSCGNYVYIVVPVVVPRQLTTRIVGAHPYTGAHTMVPFYLPFFCRFLCVFVYAQQPRCRSPTRQPSAHSHQAFSRFFGSSCSRSRSLCRRSSPFLPSRAFPEGNLFIVNCIFLSYLPLSTCFSFYSSSCYCNCFWRIHNFVESLYLLLFAGAISPRCAPLALCCALPMPMHVHMLIVDSFKSFEFLAKI